MITAEWRELEPRPQVLAYFRDHLQRGRTLSQLVLERVDLPLTSAAVSDQDIEDAFDCAKGLDWLVAIGVSSADGERVLRPEMQMTSDHLEAAADRTEMMIVSAYDGEGYAFWTPRPFLPSPNSS